MSEAQIERKSQSMTQSKMDYPHLHSPLSTTCYDVFIHIDWIVLIKCTLSKCHPGGNLDNQKEACISSKAICCLLSWSPELCGCVIHIPNRP